MSIRITVDTSDLTALVTAYAAAPEKALPELEASVERGALNIKRDARRLVRDQITGTYLPHYPRAIDYDMEVDGGSIEAEIGPDDSKPQGGMGRGVEYGSSHTGPIPHLVPAFEDELPKLEKHATRLLRQSLP